MQLRRASARTAAKGKRSPQHGARRLGSEMSLVAYLTPQPRDICTPIRLSQGRVAIERCQGKSESADQSSQNRRTARQMSRSCVDRTERRRCGWQRHSCLSDCDLGRHDAVMCHFKPTADRAGDIRICRRRAGPTNGSSTLVR